MSDTLTKEGVMTTVCHPLNVERYGRDGWFYMSCNDIPGIHLSGPDLDTLIDNAEIAIAELLKLRGQNVQRVTIETVPADQADSAPTWAPPVQHMAMAIAA